MTWAWIAVTLTAYAVGIALMFAGLGSALRHASPVVFRSALGGLLGIHTGSAQAALLRRRIRDSALWIPATTFARVLFWGLYMWGAFGRAESTGGKLAEGL